jgi:hypothetical protein
MIHRIPAVAQIKPILLAQFEPLWFSLLPKVAQIKPKCLALTDRNHWHNSNRNSQIAQLKHSFSKNVLKTKMWVIPIQKNSINTLFFPIFYGLDLTNKPATRSCGL